MTERLVIVGAPRSGTNMLRDVLTELDGYATWPCDEVNLLWKHGNRSIRSDELTPEHATPKVSRYLNRQFDKIGRRYSAHTVVEKTCATSLRVGFAAAALPDAKFIFIRRNGVDAAASTMLRWTAPFDLKYTAKKVRFVPPTDLPYYAFGFAKNRIRSSRSQGISGQSVQNWWGPRPNDYLELLSTKTLDELAAVQWRRCVETSLDDLANIEPERSIEVSYETFVAEPASELKRLLDFVGRPADFNAAAVGSVRASSVGKAHRQLDESAMDRIKTIVTPALGRLGYE